MWWTDDMPATRQLSRGGRAACASTPRLAHRKVPSKTQGRGVESITGTLKGLLIVCLVALLSACGGGSSGADGGAPPDDGKLRLVVASASLKAEASNTDDPVSRSIGISVLNLPEAAHVYVGGSYTHNAVSLAIFNWSETSGALGILFRGPGQLAPGTYTDTITVTACLETPCVHHIEGSPFAVTVTFKVTASPVKTTVTFDKSSITVQGDNGKVNDYIADNSTHFTVKDPVPLMWTRTSTAKGAAVVTYAAVEWTPVTSSTQGLLQLDFRIPATLGAGTYTDTVKVEFCLDLPCSQQAKGSPAMVAVTYNIIGGQDPNITVSWTPEGPSGGELVTTETRALKAALTLWPSTSTDTRIYVRHGNAATGVITSATEISYPKGSGAQATPGRYELTLKPPATLGSGDFVDTMEFEACFDAGCTRPVPNGKYTFTVNMRVSATEGVEYVRRGTAATSGARAMVWSEASQLLYVSTSSRIVQLDPRTLAATAGPTFGATNLEPLAMTPDGNYLYAGSTAAPYVHRFHLPSLAPDLSISLGAPASPPWVADDIATIPGQPQSFVVAVRESTTKNAGVYVYDGDTARSASVKRAPAQPSEYVRWVLPTSTPGQYLSQAYGPSSPATNTMDLLTVDASGITTTASTPVGNSIYYGKPVRAGSRLFTLGGSILDAETGAAIGKLPGRWLTAARAMAVDPVHGRLYAWFGQFIIASYDLDTYKVLGYINLQLPGISIVEPPSGKAMLTWGDDGLALLDDSGGVTLLSGPFFTTYRGEPVMSGM
jgi:hypothetical protein